MHIYYVVNLWRKPQLSKDHRSGNWPGLDGIVLKMFSTKYGDHVCLTIVEHHWDFFSQPTGWNRPHWNHIVEWWKQRPRRTRWIFERLHAKLICHVEFFGPRPDFQLSFANQYAKAEKNKFDGLLNLFRCFGMASTFDCVLCNRKFYSI